MGGNWWWGGLEVGFVKDWWELVVGRVTGGLCGGLVSTGDRSGLVEDMWVLVVGGLEVGW